MGRRVCLLAMHSVVDWMAYAVWEDGVLRRALSLSPDDGVLQDIGTRLPFEEPFWRGEHPVFEPDDPDASDYPFPFHPLDLGEAAMLASFGYQIEGNESPIDPFEVPILRFRRSSSLWSRFGRLFRGRAQ